MSITSFGQLGVSVMGAASCREAILGTPLEFDVSREPLYLDRGNGEIGEQVQAFANVRRDPWGRTIFSEVIGPKTETLQNVDAFAFFDPFVRAGLATLELAGEMRRGRVVWILAKIAGDPLVIVPTAHDVVNRYVLLANYHDGSASITAGYSAIRLLCDNQLAMARAAADSALVRVRHTKGMVPTLERTGNIMRAAEEGFLLTAQAYRSLAAREIGARELDSYVRAVFDEESASAMVVAAPQFSYEAGPMRPIGRAPKETRGEAYNRERREAVTTLFERGRGNNLRGVRGTRWAAYNAVTEYLGNDRPRGGTLESRTEALALGGKGSARGVSERALRLALAA